MFGAHEEGGEHQGGIFQFQVRQQCYLNCLHMSSDADAVLLWAFSFVASDKAPLEGLLLSSVRCGPDASQSC